MTYNDVLHDFITRIENRDALIEVAARALYISDEGEDDRTEDGELMYPWEDAPNDVQGDYRMAMAPVIDAILTHLRTGA